MGLYLGSTQIPGIVVSDGSSGGGGALEDVSSEFTVTGSGYTFNAYADDSVVYIFGTLTEDGSVSIGIDGTYSPPSYAQNSWAEISFIDYESGSVSNVASYYNQSWEFDSTGLAGYFYTTYPFQ